MTANAMFGLIGALLGGAACFCLGYHCALKWVAAELDNAELPSVRSEPLLAVYSRFKHLDSVFQMVGDSDGSDNTDPFHATTRDLWLAIKESLGISANIKGERPETRSERTA